MLLLVARETRQRLGQVWRINAHKFKFEMLVLEEESDLSDDPNEVSESDEVSDVAPDSEIEEWFPKKKN